MAMATLGQPPSSSPPTYEKILIRHGLKRQEMQRQISDDALFPIARQMTRWRSIDLGLTKGIVNAVENDPSTGEEKKQIQLLERWSESYGHEATYERLAFSFCSSSRVDLADAVCEIRKKFYLSSLPATENECELHEEKETDYAENYQPFVKAEEATVDGATADTRDIPPGQAETIGAGHRNENERPNTLPRKPPIPEEEPITFNCNPSGLQEQSNGGQSTHMVASTYPVMQQKSPQTNPSSPERTESAKALELATECAKVANQSIAHMDKLREERVAMAASNEKKVRELVDRNNKVAQLVVEKDKKIQELQKETQKMQQRLAAEQSECMKVKEDLVERDNKISQLQHDVQQQDAELQHVKDNQQKLAEVKEQLQQAKENLETERRIKTELEQKFARTSKRIEHLEKDLEKANSNVDETMKERECLESVVQWTKDDVEEEDEEDDEIEMLNFKLEEQNKEIAQLRYILNKQKRKSRIYKAAFVIVVLILACLILSRIPITCSLLFGTHTEL